MAGLENILPEARESVNQIGEAALVIALPGCHNTSSLAAAVAGLSPVLTQFLPDHKTVLLHPDSAVLEKVELSTAKQPLLLPYPLAPAGLRDQTLDSSLRALMAVGHALNARACVTLAAEAGAGMAGQIRALVEPVLNHGYDLAVPWYGRRKFAALINSGIAYPLTRALYGARLRYPMAQDFAFSSRLTGVELHPAGPGNSGPVGWITTRAVCDATMQVCQVHQDAPPIAAGQDSASLSETLAFVVGRLFVEIERRASCWQKVRTSQPVRTFGQPVSFDQETASVDVNPMIETFQRGCRDLFEIWAAILSPGTQVELRRIAKQPVGQFQLGDEIWAHVIYDFALGHRQRAISREHLFGALAPIYLGWVASFALEVRLASPEAVDQRLEALCASFEKLKPYLLSRWRWPDRFNP